MDPNFSIPIIPQNLSKQETIVRIAEVLDHLTNITEVIFDQVEKRLEEDKGKLKNISQRVSVVSEKINKLKGAKKATQVFSSSKYPASEVYKEYTSVFGDAPTVELKKHKVKTKNVSSVNEPLDKLQFYHVNIPSDGKKEKLEGLGETPLDIKYMNDLLLYNSGKNLYKNFEIADALRGPQNIKEEEDKDISDIGPAPHSISERSTLTKSTAQTYFYTPQIGEVPALDVPLDLPDLPGIADDLHYESEIEPGIAPSAATLPTRIEHLDDLPVIIENETLKEDIQNVKLPTPPPMPKKEVKPIEEPVVEVIAPVVPKPKVELPKPPEIKEETSVKDVTNVRSSLMEAIRNAGGSRKAKLRPIQEPKKETTKSTGDLMADLHLKLSMRRKGISGSKKQDNAVDAESTLGRMSAMIPPPDPKNDGDSASNDEEDWD